VVEKGAPVNGSVHWPAQATHLQVLGIWRLNSQHLWSVAADALVWWCHAPWGSRNLVNTWRMELFGRTSAPQSAGTGAAQRIVQGGLAMA